MATMEVNVITAEELPDWVYCSRNMQYAGWLEVKFPGEQHPRYFCDAMEPEDARFYRDLDWIPQLLMEAYRAGKRQGEEEKEEE